MVDQSNDVTCCVGQIKFSIGYANLHGGSVACCEPASLPPACGPICPNVTQDANVRCCKGQHKYASGFQSIIEDFCCQPIST